VLAFNGLRGVISQKIEVFMTTAVRNLNLSTLENIPKTVLIGACRKKMAMIKQWKKRRISRRQGRYERGMKRRE
jgi:hypothetical protein